MAFYYVRTTQGGFNDDLHQFTEKPQRVAVEKMRGDYFDNPKLIVQTEEEHTKPKKET